MQLVTFPTEIAIFFNLETNFTGSSKLIGEFKLGVEGVGGGNGVGIGEHKVGLTLVSHMKLGSNLQI